MRVCVCVCVCVSDVWNKRHSCEEVASPLNLFCMCCCYGAYVSADVKTFLNGMFEVRVYVHVCCACICVLLMDTFQCVVHAPPPTIMCAFVCAV